MNFKQCLFFVAKCLILDQRPEQIAEIRKAIAQESFNWENVVWLSSGQFVLPAMYLQFKRNGLIPELPSDLVEYLAEITRLNRSRNLAILEQAKEVTSILNEKDIFPVFLKGTAHLLSGLYTDPAERMIGDIDFLVPAEKMEEAANLLIKNGYHAPVEYKPEMLNGLKHYPRLQNFDCPASVEIHIEVMDPPHQDLIRGYEIIKNKQQLTEWQGIAYVPSVQHLVVHNVLNAQLNDKAQIYGDILLRQMYDLLLLSLKADVQKIAINHGKKLYTFNAYYTAICYVFSYPKGIDSQITIRTKLFRKKIEIFLTHPRIAAIHKATIYLSFRFSRYVTIPLIAVFKRDTRILLIARLNDRNWYWEHFRSYRSFFRQ